MTVSSRIIHLFVAASGIAALSWEVMWQIKSTLALGISAWGTAITLAITMGGMSLGSSIMGHALKNKTIARPIRLYGVLECAIGLAGLSLEPAFRVIEKIDSAVYAQMPEKAAMVHILGIIAALGVPAVCMGATLPVFGLVARQFRTSISVLYGLNTLGAACGSLITAFVLIPLMGLSHAIWTISAINITIGILTWMLQSPAAEQVVEKKRQSQGKAVAIAAAAYATVFVTGFASFMLEVAWFRSLTTVFKSTTWAFAVMLASVLAALGIGARLAPAIKAKKVQLGSLVTCAGILILLASPLMERVGLMAVRYSILFPGFLALIWSVMALNVIGAPIVLVYERFVAAFKLKILVIGILIFGACFVLMHFGYIAYVLPTLPLTWFAVAFSVMGAPMLLLGIALPWILDDHDTPRQWGRLYALNTFASIAGALCAGWIFLPAIGFARTAWLAGAIVTGTGILTSAPQKRRAWALAGMAALIIAVTFESGIGRTRVLEWVASSDFRPQKILEYYEGPDATVSAVEGDSFGTPVTALIINGFFTSGGLIKSGDYMVWMGRLPMLLSPDPQKALVICFGTGRTLNAVREENPASMDIVELNPHVLKLAHNFAKVNKDILSDPRLNTIVMDGRAYMRRTNKTYDVITLEPMPPNFAGVNALYSREFYELARARLGVHGILAQWVPFHLISPHSALSIAKTFQSVFPNAVLWIDPASHTGILLGSPDDKAALGASWPGFARTKLTRELSEEKIRAGVKLDRNALEAYASGGEIISDDNQLLNYGNSVYYSLPLDSLDSHVLDKENMQILKKAVSPAQ